MPYEYMPHLKASSCLSPLHACLNLILSVPRTLIPTAPPIPVHILHQLGPLVAYEHIAPILDHIAQTLGKTRETLLVYDPYFCEGSMVERLASIGFTNVYNKKEDFYARIAGTSDILVL